ncbi:SulP family inorganic anion transporter [Arthrobacter sp. PAMC25564]|uniref:SulP family inorganic anion transporter n=1 Tax=Arthrobacter sp. PAMC25564 TaxID=2565366 RepID=UPI0010A26E9B|nr:SulP family inorganic anion transporter [Arthrobacter sp. PAMC25564]QCB97449.1 SulP family inorganic anion transporter [Arthrobacter sp. PAMC25564]
MPAASEPGCPVGAGGRELTRGPVRHAWSLPPGLKTVLDYERSWLKSDLAAGAAVSAVLIPAGMAYAEASGLPAVTGLYASVIPLLAYAVFGPSRVLIVGPDSTLAPMIAAAVLPLAARGSDHAVALAGVLALMIGVILLVGRVVRLGFVTGLLSKPIRVGYLNGIALAVILSQLPKFLGIPSPGGSLVDNAAGTARAVLHGAVNPLALLFGAGTVAIIVACRFLPWKVPGVLLAVVGATALTAALDLTAAVPMVGALPGGFPSPGIRGVTGAEVFALIGPAAGIALMAFADTSVLSKSLAARRGTRVNGNQEMGALGVANAACGLFGGFPVSGSASRTPIALEAGARSPFSGVVAAALVVLFMLAVPGVTSFLPSSALAAVVIVAAASIVDVKTLIRLFRMSRREAALLLATFLGVAFVGVLEGIVVAIGLSLIAFVLRAWDPYRTELASVGDVPGYHDLNRHPEGQRVPGLVIARFDAPLFFANGAVFTEHIRTLVANAPGPVRWVIVASEAITDLDTTALDDLVELDDELAKIGISLVFAEMKGPIKDRLIRFGVSSRFGPGHFFPTVTNAVRSYKREFDLP